MAMALLTSSRLWVAVALPLAGAGAEVLVPLPAGGQVALSTRGPSALRARRLLHGYEEPIASPMIGPDGADAEYRQTANEHGTGIVAPCGSLLVSDEGELVLLDPRGAVITESLPLAHSLATSFSTRSSQLYGHGAGNWDADRVAATHGLAQITNTETFVPYYYSADGYSALGVAAEAVLDEAGGPTGSEPRSTLLVQYQLDGQHITWNHTGHFDLYLMPAASLDLGQRAYFALTGAPRIPPLYAFGFIASQWGWKSKDDIEQILTHFRTLRCPLDAIIIDFEFFTSQNDYSFEEQGSANYDDFGFSGVTFPEPRQQLARYLSEMHVRVGAIRKPRLGNASHLSFARSRGWLMPTGKYHNRYLDFSKPEVREWYKKQNAHYLEDGIAFWWNDEGEADYFTYWWWNVAEDEMLRNQSDTKRFFSLNRGFSPGLPRLGAAVWTGDVKQSWRDLRHTPGMLLKWGLAGAPYVACDIGGFLPGRGSQHRAEILVARWYQVGIFMPIMRIHSSHWMRPHFPFNELWGAEAASVMREAVQLRYQLIPYHYSLAHTMFRTGRLWMRPMVMEFPDEKALSELTSQWMDGDLLVAPVLAEDSKHRVHLPPGRWFAFNSSEVREGPAEVDSVANLSEVPVYVRQGSLVPLAPRRVPSTEDLPGGPLELQVYAGADGAFELTEDDGETRAYEAQLRASGSSVRLTRFSWTDRARTLSWKVVGTKLGKQNFREVFVTLFDEQGRRQSVSKPLGTSGSISFSSGTARMSKKLRVAGLHERL